MKINQQKQNAIPISEFFARYLYDERTGFLHFKPSSNNRIIDYAPVGTFWQGSTKSGYLISTFFYKGKTYRIPIHRIVWAMCNGEWPKGYIDHINGDGLDNRLENLRVVTHKENRRNCARRSDNKSGVTGVSRHTHNRWKVTISKKYVGVFESFDEAVEARKRAEKISGYHKNHGRVFQ